MDIWDGENNPLCFEVRLSLWSSSSRFRKPVNLNWSVEVGFAAMQESAAVIFLIGWEVKVCFSIRRPIDSYHPIKHLGSHTFDISDMVYRLASVAFINSQEQWKAADESRVRFPVSENISFLFPFLHSSYFSLVYVEHTLKHHLSLHSIISFRRE